MGYNRRKECYMNKTKILILALSVLCVLMFSAVVFIGGFKTTFFKRQFVKLGWIQLDATDSPDYWCIRGWNNTLQKLHCDVDVAFYGNSITAGSAFQDFFPDISICNLGYPGDNLDGLRFRAYTIASVKPEKVFLMGGINGSRQTPIDVFVKKYEQLILEIQKNVPSAQLYLQSILPVTPSITYASNDKIRKCNKLIDSLARVHQCQYIDLFSLYEKDGIMNEEYTRDGVHLKSEHYDKWAEAIRPYIE